MARWSSRVAFPAGAINAIAQTPDGFLWIGAENALVRFDGARFRVVEHANSPSMPPGDVLGLVVDASGALWPSPFSAALERGATALTRGDRGDVLIAPPDAPLRYSEGNSPACSRTE